MPDEGRTADLTRAAMRGLALPIEEREERLEKAAPATRELLEKEMAALQWVQAHWWVWQEQGITSEILAFLAGDGAQAEAA